MQRHFKVEFKLRQQMVVPQYPIYLDGLLHELLGDRLDALLARETHHGDWVYCASALLQSSGVMFRGQRALIRKHFGEEISLGQANGLLRNSRAVVVELKRGRDRQWLIRHPTAMPGTLVAHGVGEVETLERVLREVTCVGGLRRLGFGEVDEFNFTVDQSDKDAWRARVFPWEFPGAIAMPACTTRPPYYEGWRRTRAFAPRVLIESGLF